MQMIFVNLPVKDLNKSIEFFRGLGYKFNPQFTDETATSMVVSDTIYFMLLTEAKFKSFIHDEICDTKKAREAIICLNCESRAGVDEMVDKAIKLGAKSHGDPDDYGFMYSRSFYDLDGHAWNYIYMDPSFVKPVELV